MSVAAVLTVRLIRCFLMIHFHNVHNDNCYFYFTTNGTFFLLKDSAFQAAGVLAVPRAAAVRGLLAHVRRYSAAFGQRAIPFLVYGASR
jgi:hypothetical protein